MLGLQVCEAHFYFLAFSLPSAVKALVCLAGGVESMMPMAG
jgi:hypothetical protein